MSHEITTAMVEQYKSNVVLLSQQKGSRLRGSVRIESHIGENGSFEQIMEDWMGDENVRVYVTEAGKNVDSYSYFSKNKKGEPENGQPMPFNKFIDENPAEAFLLACKGLYSKGMFIEHETDAVECTIPIDKTNNACVIMSDDALNELMSD